MPDTVGLDHGWPMMRLPAEYWWAWAAAARILATSSVNRRRNMSNLERVNGHEPRCGSCEGVPQNGTGTVRRAEEVLARSARGREGRRESARRHGAAAEASRPRGDSRR